jgi:RNA polymerase sigma-70 factor (ECF subfamily)
MMTKPRDVTRLLMDWCNGDRDALTQLMPLVYDELRRLASRYLHDERPDHTLQTTALVHEAYLRLVDQCQADWQNRAQFFGVAAQIMRRILVDHARRHHAARRGGPERPLPLDNAPGVSVERAAELVVLDDALTRLATVDA